MVRPLCVNLNHNWQSDTDQNRYYPKTPTQAMTAFIEGLVQIADIIIERMMRN